MSWHIGSRKLRETLPSSDPMGRWLCFWCPGCKMAHAIPVEKRNPSNGALWSFDGNLDAPTFSPSLHLPGVCHSFVRAGRIEFLSDSGHALAGQTVELPDFPAEEDEGES